MREVKGHFVASLHSQVYFENSSEALPKVCNLSFLARASRALPQLKHKTRACTYLTQLRRQRNFNYDNAENINPHLSKHALPPPLFLFSLYIFYFRRGAESFTLGTQHPLTITFSSPSVCIYLYIYMRHTRLPEIIKNALFEVISPHVLPYASHTIVIKIFPFEPWTCFRAEFLNKVSLQVVIYFAHQAL
jgi:hypothetical protein